MRWWLRCVAAGGLALLSGASYAQTSYNIRTVVGAGITSYVPQSPHAIAVEASGTVLFSDKAQVLRLDPQTGRVSIVAGTGDEGFSGDGGPARSAQLGIVNGIALDVEGNIYLADPVNSRVRRIGANSNVISTFAGTSVAGFSGDGGPATSAKLDYPRGVTYDPSGAILVADSANNRLRRVDLQTGVITTLVGGGILSSGTPAQVHLCGPIDAAVADNGDVYIAEGNCGSVMRFSKSDGQVAPYVNQRRQRGNLDVSTPNPLARDYSLSIPYALEFDLDGNLLIADLYAAAIIRIDKDTTFASVLAGPGYFIDTPDSTAAVNRSVVSAGIARGENGVLYTAGRVGGVSEPRIEFLTPLSFGDPTQIITRVAGMGRVAFSPAGQECGTNCRQFAFGSTVTLTAVPSPGSTFAGWARGCSGLQTTCSVRPGVTRPVDLYFGSPVGVVLETTGSGNGTIRSNPTSVDCSTRCVVGFLNVSVQFTASPAPGSRFVSWEGYCAGVAESTCSRSFFSSANGTTEGEFVVRARFELNSVPLRIEFFGTGTGKVDVVSSSSVLRSCTATCTVDVRGGEQISLRPDSGNPFIENASGFAGWRTCTNGVDPVYDGFYITVGVAKCIGAGFYLNRTSSTNRVSFAGLPAIDGSFIREAYGALWTSSEGALLVGQKPVAGPYSFTALRTPGAGYRPIWHVDLNRDVWNEIVFQKTDQLDGFGPVSSWLTYQSTQLTSIRSVRLNWELQAAGDLDGDGFGDLVWRYVQPGSNDTGVSYIWFMRNGQVEQVRKRGGAPLDWKLIGAIDINRDGADEMFYVSPSGDIRVLFSTPGRTCANLSAGRLPSGYQPLAVGGFSPVRPGGEILVRNPLTGTLGVIQISGYGMDLPAATADPDDPNAACTPSATTLSTTFKSYPSTGVDWTYIGRDRPFNLNARGQDVILFARPDRRIMLLEVTDSSSASGAGPAQFVDAGEVPLGYRMVNK